MPGAPNAETAGISSKEIPLAKSNLVSICFGLLVSLYVLKSKIPTNTWEKVSVGPSTYFRKLI